MWQRSILKANAKIALKGRYWIAFVVTLVAMVIGSAYSTLTMGLQKSPMAGAVSIGGILFSVFVAIPISIGVMRYFLQNHFGAAKFETMFSGFQQGYLNGIGAMLVTGIFIFLWSLLLIVPGIIKAFQYCLVPFILSDNPDMPGSRAREISKMLTDGEKGNIFVFYLSFIGWFFLGILCLGVGILYIFLRDRAIANNMLNPAELNLVPPEPTSAV